MYVQAANKHHVLMLNHFQYVILHEDGAYMYIVYMLATVCVYVHVYTHPHKCN